MEITFVNKNKAIQPMQIQDTATDPSRNVNTEENKKYVIKNKVDSAEISSSHTGSFDDKRITVAKSSVLYDVSVNTSTSHVQDIKNAVEKGTYDVPTNLLADAILK